MSSTTGIDEQVLSLPKGGGAVKGLGTTFETDLNTGTGSYSIPIDTPAGPNGIQPKIGIRYHSAAGNGPFGVGWTPGSMTIARKIEGRIPNYGPNDNEFTLVGVDDLVPIGNGRYRPRVDTMHYRIEQKGDGWEIKDTRGTCHRLGMTPQTRIEILDGPLTKTAAWLLEEIEDLQGNTVRFSYKKEGVQRYLEKIEWGTYELRFFYEQRPDQLSDGRFGFLLKTGLRCSGLELHVTNLAPSLARSWTLEYQQAPGSALSLLHRVTMRGHNADGSTIEAPPLTMEYTGLQPRELESFTAETPEAVPGSFSDRQMELVDWDGDGLPDLLEIGSGQARMWPNQGRCRWGYPRSLPSLPAPIAMNEPGVAFADMEGNGTADLIMLDRPLSGYYPHRPGGGFERPVFWQQTPSPRLTDGNVRLVDLDGDGITDMLVTGDHFYTLYYRDGQNGWNPRPQTIPRSQVPPVSLADQRVFLADINGDGLQDMVRVDGAGVKYWPYLGNGRWAGQVEMANPPRLPRDFDPGRLFFTDIDGDGCADLVYVDFDRVIYWLNQGGVSLGDPVEIAYTPPAQLDRFRLADMKGSGTAGVLWSYTGPVSRSSGFYYLDFTGGVKPYLLKQIDNGMGLVSRISYKTSTEYALDDAARGNPWPTFHPFPVQCVSEVEHVDTITGKSALTRNFYHNGRYDSQSHTFLGFGKVETEVLGDAAIPTLFTRNFYHLGLDPAQPERVLKGEERLRLGALRRRLLRTEVYSPDGSPQEEQPYHVTIHDYDTRLEPAENGMSVAVPYETRTLEEQWERGTAPFAFREITYQNIDEYGNIQKQQLRIWREGEPVPDQDVTTDIFFAINPQAYIVSLPARVTQREADGSILADTITFFDGPAHQGLPQGQVTRGEISRVEALAVPDDLANTIYGAEQPAWEELGYHRLPGESGWWVTRNSYEHQEIGGEATIITRGPRGFDTRMVLDPTRQYPKQLTDAAGNTRTGQPDERVFQMATHTEPNGNEVVDHFDALGRVTAIIKPGDTPALPTTVYSYRTDIFPLRLSTFNRQRHGENDTLDDYQYFNGRGEFIQRIVEGEGDAGREFIVEEAREYTVRGQISKRYLPYYVSSPEYAAPDPARAGLNMRYDALGRLVEQQKASGTRITQTFKPGYVEMLDEADNAAPVPTPRIHRLDGLQRILAVENHLTGGVVKTQYKYNALGHLVWVRNPDGGESRISYDLLGRILGEETPDTGKTIFVVDASGNQVRRTTASGKTVLTSYDRLDRILEVREEGAADPEMVYTYLDSGDAAPADGWQNRRGRPYQVQDRVGTMTYSYDSLGRISQTQRTINALGGHELETDFSFDALNRQTQIKLPAPTPGAGRRIVEYHYNKRGLLESSPGIVRSSEYDVQGHMTRLVYQNNVENIVNHDMLTGRPQQIQVIGPGGTVLRDQSFAFDPVGNLTRIDSPLALEAAQFTYDDLYRLKTADYSSGEHFGYDYSSGGNITHIDGLGSLTYAGPQGSGAVTNAGGEAYTYDPDGHLKTAPYGNLEFNSLDNLVKVDLADGRRMECVYDFLGQRAIKRMSDGSETITADMHLDFHNGQPVIWITFGKKRILAIVNGGGVFLHSDLQGTPTLYTRVDGTEARRLAVGPYGTLRFDSAAASITAAVSFIGKMIDNETGLICMGRRFYDPRLGRFISPDRVVPGIYALDAWNRYIYGHNNPLRFIDPTGRLDWKDILAIVGVAIVVAALVVAGIFTMGTTWALAAGIAINVGGLLIGTAVGVAAGATLGGIAAAQAGGDIWAGILFGGAVGGVAAFAGGILGTLAGGAIGSLVTSQLGIYLAGGVGGAVQGAIIGAGTGAAIGFAGGKGSAESIWTHIWKGAAMGAVTGAALGVLSAYLMTTPNPTLRVGTLEKINPQNLTSGGVTDYINYFDTYAALGQGVANTAATGSGTAGIGTFISVGSGPGAALLNIPLDWVPQFLFQYGGFVLITSSVIGIDKFTGFDFDDMLILGLEMVPYFIGVFFVFADIGNWGWFEDMKEGLHKAFSMPEP